MAYIRTTYLIGAMATLNSDRSAITGISIRDTSAAFDVTLAATSSTTLTVGRTLTFDVTNAARIIKLTGNPTLADWFDQNVKASATPLWTGTHTFSNATNSAVFTGGNVYVTSTLMVGASGAPISGIFQGHIATNVNLCFDSGGTGIARLDAVNDAGNANVPLQLQGTTVRIQGSSGVGINALPVSEIFRIQAAANANFVIDTTSSNLRISTVNDADNSNTPMVLQASSFLMAVGVVQMNAYGSGAATFDASGNITSVSDETMKTNIIPSVYGLKELRAFKPIIFNYHEKSKLDTKYRYGGWGAQSVLPWIPEAVGMNRDGTRSLNPWPIVGAIQNAVLNIDSRLGKLELAVASGKT